jgi:hypothetical protein
MRFENFLADMGEKPEGLELDRKDNDGNYDPANCRWVSRTEQIRNSRVSKLTLFQANFIRALAVTFPHNKIADAFGVTKGCVGFIVRGETWRDAA